MRAEILAANSVHAAAASAAKVASLRADRIMAHMLLLTRDVTPGDLANPTRWARITYSDLPEFGGAADGGGIDAQLDALEAQEGAGLIASSDGEGGLLSGLSDGEAVSDLSSGSSDGERGDIMGDLAAAEASRGSPAAAGKERSEMDALFAKVVELVPQGGVPKPGGAAAAAASGEAVAAADAEAGTTDVEVDEDGDEVAFDASGRPLFGARVSSADASFDPSIDASPSVMGGHTDPAVGGAWLEVAAGHIEVVLGRLRRHAAALPSGAAGAAAALVPLSGSDAVHAQSLLDALSSVPAAPVPADTAAWLAALPADKLGSLMTRLLLRRRGFALPLSAGGAAADGSSLSSRIGALESALGVLRMARAGSADAAGETVYPTAAGLHSALASAVGEGVPLFTPLRSAAAALAHRTLASLAAEQARLDEAVSHARATRLAYFPSEASSSPAPSWAITVPSLEALLATPGFAPDVVTVEVSGTPGGEGDGALAVALDVPHAHARRVRDGQLGAVLSPLAAVLTPAEHAALVSLAVMGNPGMREDLSHTLGEAEAAAEVEAAEDGSGDGTASGTGALSDAFDSLGRSRHARKLLEAEADVAASLTAAVEALAADGGSGGLPPGFDVAGWKSYVGWVLELARDPASASVLGGREATVRDMLRGALRALPPGVRARLPSLDPIKDGLDEAGVDEAQLARAAAELGASRSGLTADAADVLRATGAGIASVDGEAFLPLDSSAGVLAGRAGSPGGGPSPAAAAGGSALPRPSVRQYYPVTRPVYAPDGVTVLRHEPVVSRLPEDLAGTGLTSLHGGLAGTDADGRSPVGEYDEGAASVAAIDGVISRSLAALAAEAAAGDIAGDLAAAKRRAYADALAPLVGEGGEEAREVLDAVALGGGASLAGGLPAGMQRLGRALESVEERAELAGEEAGEDSEGADLTSALLPTPVTPATLAAHEAGAGGGGLVSEPSPRVRHRARRARRARSEAAQEALIEEAASRGLTPAQMEMEARPWHEVAYGAAPAYRASGAYSLLHERLLEAGDARDLEAMFALWHAHTRMQPQVRAAGRLLSLWLILIIMLPSTHIAPPT